MKINKNGHYYEKLGVSKDATREEIIAKYNQELNRLSKYTITPENNKYYQEGLQKLFEAKMVLTDERSREFYDKLIGYHRAYDNDVADFNYERLDGHRSSHYSKEDIHDNDSNKGEHFKKTTAMVKMPDAKIINKEKTLYPNKPEEKTIKVINMEEAPKKTVNKGNKILMVLDTALVVILITGWTVYYNHSKNNTNDKVVENSNTTTEEAAVAATSTNSNAATIATSEEAAIAATSANQDIATTAWNKISALQAADSQYASDITENDVKKLVEWAKHEKAVMPNAKAYGMLQELAEDNKFNISELITNKNNKDTVNNFVKAFDGVEENNTLTDENNCFVKVKEIIPTLPNDDPTVANEIAAELYAHYAVNPELPEACGEAQTNGQEGSDYQKLINTISQDEINANNATMNAYYSWVNPVLDISDKEDNTKKLVLTK